MDVLDGLSMSNTNDQRRRISIFEEIEAERARQDKQWGTEFDDKNGKNDWGTFVNRYVSRACDDSVLIRDKLTSEGGFLAHYRHNMLKAVAVAVAALEAFDRDEARKRVERDKT